MTSRWQLIDVLLKDFADAEKVLDWGSARVGHADELWNAHPLTYVQALICEIVDKCWAKDLGDEDSNTTLYFCYNGYKASFAAPLIKGFDKLSKCDPTKCNEILRQRV